MSATRAPSAPLPNKPPASQPAPDAVTGRPPTIATRVLSALFWLYKAATANRSPACRFTPSCSEYAHEALQRFGPRKALPLVAKRLVRCRPGGPFGFDPVPQTLPAHQRDLPRAPDLRGDSK